MAIIKKVSEHPTTALATLVVVICSIRFLFDGVVIHGFTLSHMDASAYAAILTPVLGAHGWIRGKVYENGQNERIDNPDGK